MNHSFDNSYNKLDNHLNEEAIKTPAFVYSEKKLMQTVNAFEPIRSMYSNRLLFSLKSFAIADALTLLASHIDGFSVSSLFEAKLAKDILGTKGYIHAVTPGYKPDEIETFAGLTDYITFNSLSQWERFSCRVAGRASCGVRINPGLSFVEDNRYNPCRRHSKLGVPLNQLISTLDKEERLYKEIEGVHFHTNSASESYLPLLNTIHHLDKKIPRLLSSVSWINLGGGYYVSDVHDINYLYEAIGLLKDKYGLEVFIEPGQGVVEEAGYIVSSVIDLFENDGKNIAILDTTVNHMPEVFEYQYKPDIMEESPNGQYEYLLAGCTCLAGDLFGDYRFDKPLGLGDKIVFQYMGAYTLVKAHMFNGVNLPSIYALTTEGKLELRKQFSYEDYVSRYGAIKNVPI